MSRMSHLRAHWRPAKSRILTFRIVADNSRESFNYAPNNGRVVASSKGARLNHQNNEQQFFPSCFSPFQNIKFDFVASNFQANLSMRWSLQTVDLQ